MPTTLDLRGVACPTNYVRVRLALEGLDPGEEIALLLDPGEPVANVPRSLHDDGDKVLGIEKASDHFVVRVRKGEGDDW